MMHFPQLTRRPNYKKTRKGDYYASYSEYYTEIAEDCQYRCVYCDVVAEEIGGEGMQLDHFKPQKHFPQLDSNPENLVLACAVCNRLKSDWWPGITCDTKNGTCGFIDPFITNKNQYFLVNTNGQIIPKTHPSKYLIELLSLNRVTRVTIRRKRIILSRATSLLQFIEDELTTLVDKPINEIKARMPQLVAALGDVRALLQI